MSQARVVQRQCQLCEAHCGIRVHVEGTDVTRIEGDPADVLSRGYICPKATALADLHHDPERLRQPLVRVGDGFEEVSWQQALAEVGQRVRRLRARHGRDAVGIYQGNPTAHSSSALAIEVLKKALGTRQVFSASSVDQFPQYVAAMEMFGDHTLMPIADVDRTDHLLVIGANPAVSNGSITTMPDARGRLKAIRARGGQVVVVDPRRTETARIADEHIAVRPGGDPYLLLGMLHVILDRGLDRPALPVNGLRQVSELAAAWSPSRAAGPAGVGASVIQRTGEAFASAERACAYGRIGVCHQPTGTLTHWLINVLNVLTGNLDRPGGAMFATPPVDLGAVLGILHGRSRRGRWTGRASGLAEVTGELPVTALPDEALTRGRGRLRGLLVIAGNPALSSPQAARIEQALESLDLLVCVDPYLTETSRLADIVLPPVSHLERDDLDVVFPYFSVRNNLRWSPRVFEPGREGRTDWEILLRLAAEVPGGAGGAVLRQPLRGIAGTLTDTQVVSALVAAGPQGFLRRGPGGVSARKVMASPGGVDLGPLEPRMPKILATADRRIQLAPPTFLSAAAALEALPATGDQPGGSGRDLQLIGRRHLRSNNSWLHNVESMVKGRDRCTVAMHPQDAGARSLVDGQQVRVTSRVGAIELPVEVSEDLRPGVVAIPHGWGHDRKGVGWSTAQAHAGVNANILTDASLMDTVSGNAALNATWVHVSAV